MAQPWLLILTFYSFLPYFTRKRFKNTYIHIILKNIRLSNLKRRNQRLKNHRNFAKTSKSIGELLPIPPGVWHDMMGRIRVSCRKTLGAALLHSRGTGYGQTRTSDCCSPDTSRQHPGLQDGNTHTPSLTDARIPEETARNNKRIPDKKPCVPDDAGGRSLSWQGG